ncbi:ankyrin repeat-containing domain protein [Halteromyces radiatus]|uniref:ankyrin repeat-containing domain protein n=1 Tax=Halteromyces radiatus TaxID=101107 RepID=UPI0022200D71|nr:ankyrin repeat-containing domain protein [Halteromyces radiatus]KAI8099684.1 ankyrin repeat-containing domain protein [Halteromyces radiatus]
MTNICYLTISSFSSSLLFNFDHSFISSFLYMHPVSLNPTPPITPTDAKGATLMNWPLLSSKPVTQIQQIDLPLLQRYLDRGGDYNVRHPGTGLSLLAWAIKCSSLQGIQLLVDTALKKNNNNNKKKRKKGLQPVSGIKGKVYELVTFNTGNGVTAIHLAAQQNLVQALSIFSQALQQEQIDLNFRSSSSSSLTAEWLGIVDSSLSTPLHYGVRSNSCQAVDFILHHGAFGSPRNRTGVTPLALALLLNHVDLVRRLIHTLDEHDFVVLLQQKEPFFGNLGGNNSTGEYTTMSDHLWTLVFDQHYGELDHDDNSELQRDEWLYLTVFWNRSDVLARLLQYQQERKRNNIHQQQQGTLSPSRQSSSSSLSGSTIGIHPGKQQKWLDNSIVFYALQQGKIDMVKQLFMAGHTPPISPSGDNPCLLYASAHGYLDIISLLYTPTTSDDCMFLTLQMAGPSRSLVLHELNAVMTLDKIMLLNPTDMSALLS